MFLPIKYQLLNTILIMQKCKNMEVIDFAYELITDYARKTRRICCLCGLLSKNQ